MGDAAANAQIDSVATDVLERTGGRCRRRAEAPSRQNMHPSTITDQPPVRDAAAAEASPGPTTLYAVVAHRVVRFFFLAPPRSRMCARRWASTSFRSAV